MLFFGGAIGGGLGGAAYGINLTIYKSRIPTAGKVVLNILTGVFAFVLWIFIAAAVHLSLRK